MGELLIGLTKYFAFYNGERPHQALRNLTPDMVHQRAEGGGAMIMDNYGAAQGLPVALRSTDTAFDVVRLVKTKIPKTKNRGRAVRLLVQASAT